MRICNSTTIMIRRKGRVEAWVTGVWKKAGWAAKTNLWKIMSLMEYFSSLSTVSRSSMLGEVDTPETISELEEVDVGGDVEEDWRTWGLLAPLSEGGSTGGGKTGLCSGRWLTLDDVPITWWLLLFWLWDDDSDVCESFWGGWGWGSDDSWQTGSELFRAAKTAITSLLIYLLSLVTDDGSSGPVGSKGSLGPDDYGFGTWDTG